MNRTIAKCLIAAVAPVVLCASSWAGEIRFTPVASTDPEATFDLSDPLNPSVLMAPGESVLIEVQVANWGPDQLRTVQVDLDTSGLTSGAAGSLAALNLDSDPPDGSCDAAAADAGLCPICSTNNDFDGAYIDACRNRCVDEMGPPCDTTDFVDPCNGAPFTDCLLGFPDFIANMPGYGAASMANNPNTLVALVTANAGSAADDGSVHYVASFVLQSTPDAAGEFTIVSFFDGEPGSDNGGSFTRNPVNLPAGGSDTLGQFRVIFPEVSPGEILFTPVASSDPDATIDTSDPLDPIITMSAGEAVLVEIQVRGWAPDNLRTVQVDMDTSGLTSGVSGSLSAFNMDSDPPDGSCDAAAADAGLCPICPTNNDFDGAYIDTCRNRCVDEMGPPCDTTDFVDPCNGAPFTDCLLGFPDFIANMPGFGAASMANNHNTLVALVTSNAGSAADDGGTHYVVSFVLEASTDAEGLFVMEPFVEGDPDSDNGGTFTRNPDSLPTNGSDILGRFRVNVLSSAVPEACCFPAGGCEDLVSGVCMEMGGLPQGPDSSCTVEGCPAPPEIVHGDGQDGETSPCSGYIDPLAESTNGQDLNLGLDTLDILFSEPVFAVGGGALSPADFAVLETGVSFGIDQSQVPGGTGSSASGLGNVSLNDAETELTIHVEHTLASVSVGHIHRGAAGTNGPVVFPFPSAASPIDAVWSLSPSDVADLKAGMLYVNLHSAAFPGGEIRGQIPGPNSVISVDASANPLVTVTLDRFLSLQEWTTVQANVQNAAGILIANSGDLGSMDEPDRIDVAFLPADVNNNGSVNPLDLLKFKQYVNGIDTPDCGTLLDFIDTNRNGSINPLDLLAFKRLINDISPSTQGWAFESMNSPRP